MKCHEVDPKPVLEFIAACERGEKFWYPDEDMRPAWGDKVAHQAACAFHGFENSLDKSTPKGVSAQGVAKRLISEGLISGCTCGCRGDYELTEKGRQFIAA